MLSNSQDQCLDDIRDLLHDVVKELQALRCVVQAHAGQQVLIRGQVGESLPMPFISLPSDGMDPVETVKVLDPSFELVWQEDEAWKLVDCERPDDADNFYWYGRYEPNLEQIRKGISFMKKIRSQKLVGR